MSRFGSTLKRLRLKHGGVLEALSASTGIHFADLSRYETGRTGPTRDPGRIDRIARGLKLSEQERLELHDAARREGQLPPDIVHLTNRPMVLMVLRAIDKEQLSDASLGKLIEQIRGK